MALIIFNKKNEAYFESLTVKMEKPKAEIFRIVERDIDPAEGASKWNTPSKDSGEAHPKEQPKSRADRL